MLLFGLQRRQRIGDAGDLPIPARFRGGNAMPTGSGNRRRHDLPKTVCPLALAWCLLLLLLGLGRNPLRASDQPTAEGARPSREWNVLMIGNSYTYFNNLPRLLEQMGLSDQPPRRVHCTMITAGGATLEQHWAQGKALKAIERGGWDFVVLQEQSTLGVTYLVQGQPRIVESSKYITYARRFDAAIRKAGARTVLFAFWARENAPEEDKNALAYYHFRAGKELEARVVPVGLAWQAVRKRDPHPALYQDDHSHPRAEGSYLAACVLYAACFGKAPAAPPLAITGKPITHDGAEGQETRILVQVSPERARLFREAADEALESGRQFARELNEHQPTPPPLPQLARGHRPTTQELAGDWTGETRVYPTPAGQAATMHLHLAQVRGNWQAEGTIAFGGKGTDIVLRVKDFQITDEGVTFVDTNQGPNGGAVARYRGAYTGQSLRGVAEITLKEKSLYVIGTWELKKK
jgi:hypothetical protein